jgi:penicillin amidase
MVDAILGLTGLKIGKNLEMRQVCVPAQNLIRRYKWNMVIRPGNIPIRKPGHDGRLPVPGWTDDYEWQGYIPFEELPYAFNPPQGYVVTANNAVVGKDYPYSISREWDYGYRAKRIVEMIESAPVPITIEYVQEIQGDNKDLNAERLVPILMQLPFEETRLQEALALFDGWDYQADMDQAAPALFNVFWRHLLALTFHDDLPERYWPEGDSRWFTVVRDLVDEPQSAWWDDQMTTEVETRDEIFQAAVGLAVDELEELQGDEPANWDWGKLHGIVFRNPTLGESGIGLIEGLFNRGPYQTSGTSSVVNDTGWILQSDLNECIDQRVAI